MTTTPAFSVCVYCGSRAGLDEAYAEIARETGQWIGERGGQLVYGGGCNGLMGVVAQATQAAGGRVVGIIPQALVDKEWANTACDELHVVQTMHERKAMMAERSDAFLALPGGIGTFEELFEVWTWRQLGYHDKPFNIQPFLADKNVVQQGYLTSEPFAIQKAGVKANTFLLSDNGYPSYATTISCLEPTIAARPKVIADFVKATAEGWKSYLADPAPGNALIKKDNPNMTDDQLNHSVAKLKEMGIVGSGDAATQGIGIMSEARMKANYDFLVSQNLIDPAKIKIDQAYRLDFVKAAKVLP